MFQDKKLCELADKLEIQITRMANFCTGTVMSKLRKFTFEKENQVKCQ